MKVVQHNRLICYECCLRLDYYKLLLYLPVIVDLTILETTGNQSAESTDGLGLHIGGSQKLSSLSKHEVFE